MDTDHGVSDALDPPSFDQAANYSTDKAARVDLGGRAQPEWQHELPRFEVFFAQHHDFVWRNLRRLGVHESTIDDATQEVFVRLHRNWQGFRGDAPARVWVFGYVRRVAAHYRRTEFRRRRKHDAWRQRFEQSQGFGRALSPGPDSIFAALFLRRLLAALSESERELFVASELEGLTGPELAELSNCKLATVYSRIRALRIQVQRIRGELETEYREQPSAHCMKMPALALLALVFEVPGGGAQRNWLALQAALPSTLSTTPMAAAPFAAGWLASTGPKLAALGLASLTFGGAGLLLADGIERRQWAAPNPTKMAMQQGANTPQPQSQAPPTPPAGVAPATAPSIADSVDNDPSPSQSGARAVPDNPPAAPITKKPRRTPQKIDRDAQLRTEQRLLQAALEAFADDDFTRCLGLLDLADSVTKPGVFTQERARLRGRAQQKLSH